MIDVSEREALMVEAYGEVCTRAKAARILDRSPETISHMVADGRLEAACEDTRIDVRSIARYIAAPKQVEEIGRKNRVKMRRKSNYAV